MFHKVHSWIKNSTHNVENGKPSTIELLNKICGRNTDSFHNVDIALWYFSQCEIKSEYRAVKALNMVCNWIFYSVNLACPEITKMTQFVMPKMTKIMRNLFCMKCQKSRYFCGRILARILRSRKVYEVFHVWRGESECDSPWRSGAKCLAL